MRGAQAEDEAWRNERGAWETGPDGTGCAEEFVWPEEAITFFFLILLLFKLFNENLYQLPPQPSALQNMSMNIHMTLTAISCISCGLFTRASMRIFPHPLSPVSLETTRG